MRTLIHNAARLSLMIAADDEGVALDYRQVLQNLNGATAQIDRLRSGLGVGKAEKPALQIDVLPLQPDVLAASATCKREQPDRRYGIDGAMLFDLPVQSDRQPLQLVDREKALHLTSLATFAVIIFRLTANCRIAD